MESIERGEYSRRLDVFFNDLGSQYTNSAVAYTSSLSRFFSDLTIVNKAFLQYKIEADRYLSTEFNVFSFLSTEETALSIYIGMILDVNGVHGQRDLFQRLFIEFLNEKYLNKTKLRPPLLRYSVYTEYSADGRIDLYLRSEHAGIIIENKPYAADQENQLSRYYENIKKNIDEVFIVYLSSGEDPSEESLPKELREKLTSEQRFATIALHHFGDHYIGRCIEKCESQKFRFFLSDFREFLLSTFKPAEEADHESAQ